MKKVGFVMEILAVIPARGGSKGIPRKNVRLIAGKPLIYYAIHNAQQCGLITDVAVSSDDEEILTIAENYHAVALSRSSALAQDAVTLDPVIFDAVEQMEKRKNKRYDIVITLQATSPVLRSDTLRDAVLEFVDRDADTYISATNKPHLSWSKDEEGRFFPLYKERLNRQQLPPNYLEAGAFLITRRENVTPNSRLGKSISVYELPESEAIDIDSPADWIVCESILGKKRIVLRADGYKQIGMGHIYHCLTLAYNLVGHEIMFVSRADCTEGIQKIKDSFMPLTIVRDDEEFFRFLKEYQPDIVVNDCLDTSAEYMKALKQLCKRVVTIEDMGEGIRYADVVINALYDNKDETKNGNVYSGEKYICLRDEFLISEPKPFSPEVKTVLSLFGGTDPSNMTSVIYRLAGQMHQNYPNVRFVFLAGIGYDCEKNGIVTREEENIFVVKDAKYVSAYMRQADLAFTSQGRTVYEFAAMGVPAIDLAQNEREQLHTFAQMNNGFFNLGLGKDVRQETIERSFEFLMNTPQLRSEMRNLMLARGQELKNGVHREVKLILGE